MAATPEIVKHGTALFRRYCVVCHGVDGEGDGRMAASLTIRPRDLTDGTYLFQEVSGAETATDLDLYYTLTRGIPGSGMPSWSKLSDRDRWALVHFVRSLAEGEGGAQGPTDEVLDSHTMAVTNPLEPQGEIVFRRPDRAAASEIPAEDALLGRSGAGGDLIPSPYQMEEGAIASSPEEQTHRHYCGECHDGEVTWNIEFATCNRCHRPRPLS
jgi:mono/diheme cytochrome c family protein